MPPVLLAAAASAVGAAATALITTGTLIGASTAIIGAAVAGGITAMLSMALAPSPKNISGEGQVSQKWKRTEIAPVGNARWIVGRKRVSGFLAYYKEYEGNSALETLLGAGGSFGSLFSTIIQKLDSDRANYLDMILILSQDECEGIEKIWHRGTEIILTKTTGTNGIIKYTATTKSGDANYEGNKYADNFEAWQCFSANGSENTFLQSLLTDWTATDKLLGLSFVVVRMKQPPYEDADDRVWTESPDLSFLVKGIKIAYPGQATKTWTNNAAAIWYWWLTERRGIDSLDIDTSSFTDCFNRCNENPGLSSLAGYDPATHGTVNTLYAIDGVISNGDDVTRIETNMSFAMAGDVFLWDGKYYFVAGGQSRPTPTIIDDSLLLEPAKVRTSQPINRRINGVYANLPQSEMHAYREWTSQEVDISQAIDPDEYAITELEEKHAVQLNDLFFVNSPARSIYLMHIFLRRARQPLEINMRLRPGYSFNILSIKPKDIITVTLKDHDLTSERMEVIGTSCNADWSVNILAKRELANTYATNVALPEIVASASSLVLNSGIPNPTGLSSSLASFLDEEGNVRFRLTLDWNRSLGKTLIELQHTAPNGSVLNLEAESGGIRYTFGNLTLGNWTATLRTRNLAGQESSGVSISGSITTADIPTLPAPVFLSSEQRGNLLGIQLVGGDTNFPRNVAGIEIRYSIDENLSGTGALPVINATNWNNFPVLEALPILHTGSTIYLDLALTRTGRYSIYGRYRSKQETWGTIAHLLDIDLEIATASHSVTNYAPDFDGTLTNFDVIESGPVILASSLAPASTRSGQDFDGRNGYPFGAVTLSKFVKDFTLELNTYQFKITCDGYLPSSSNLLSYTSGKLKLKMQTTGDSGMNTYEFRSGVARTFTLTNTNLTLELTQGAADVLAGNTFKQVAIRNLILDIRTITND